MVLTYSTFIKDWRSFFDRLKAEKSSVVNQSLKIDLARFVLQSFKSTRDFSLDTMCGSFAGFLQYSFGDELQDVFSLCAYLELPENAEKDGLLISSKIIKKLEKYLTV